MLDFDAYQAALRVFVRNYIEQRLAAGVSRDDVAKTLGCKTQYTYHLTDVKKYGEKNIGAKIETNLANAAFGGSIDLLRRTVMHIAGGVESVTEGVDDPPPAISPTPPSSPSQRPPSAPPAASKKRRRQAR